jgi:hypothetical protein
MRIKWDKIDVITYDLSQMALDSLSEYLIVEDEYAKCQDHYYRYIDNQSKRRMKYLEKRIAEKCNYKFV